jgi:hypothetical protein
MGLGDDARTVRWNAPARHRHYRSVRCPHRLSVGVLHVFTRSHGYGLPETYYDRPTRCSPEGAVAIGRKTGGRVKGTPNKRTAEVQEGLDALGCDPIEGMALLVMDIANRPEL